MAINPIQGVFINGWFYEYVIGSYNRTYLLKNKTTTTQRRKTTTINGNDFPIHTIGLHLNNSYIPIGITTGLISTDGLTTWLGTSRLSHLIGIIGDNNSNNFPLIFVCPDGSTHQVIPTNSGDVSIFNPDAPNTTGVEWRMNLTLENIYNN